jgi:hypothetical protein
MKGEASAPRAAGRSHQPEVDTTAAVTEDAIVEL